MKKTFIFFNVFLFFLLPQLSFAQVSEDIARLLKNAKIQVYSKTADMEDFTLPLLNGENITLSSLKGKTVILNFWATWCPPCRAEMPSMDTFYKRYKDKSLEILAVDIGENINTVRQFIQKNNYSFPILLDTTRRISSIYGIEAIPTTYIIDRQGKIIGRVVGSIYWDTPQVYAAFDKLLN
ncbi:MAG: TlpA family protein disulfide reductase [Treponema sp.]|nr:TlpA family protein disulfide reductase [Treponema sp.]